MARVQTGSDGSVVLGPSRPQLCLLHEGLDVGDRLVERLPPPVGQGGVQRQGQLVGQEEAASLADSPSAWISGKSR